MGKEIERKFLVKAGMLKLDGFNGTRITQGYLHSDDRVSIRVRLQGGSACLTIKSGAEGPVRSEFEYPVPVEEARALLGLCEGHVIEKTRYIVPHRKRAWEVDVFAGENEGLVIAELELEHVKEHIDLPDWVGDEVTEDRRYYNPYLAGRPYNSWSEQV